MICIILGIALMAGCPQKHVAKAPEDVVSSQPEPKADKDKKDDSMGIQKETVRERPLKGQGAEDQLSVEELQSRLQDIYFDFDKYEIREDAKPILRELTLLLSRTSSIKVVVEGHCDERGTNEYNLALGDRRARSVRDHIVSLGIPSSRIETVSYGEEKPVCTEHSEGCWARNRRAHFVLIKETR
jgi:peptidoglycan-associated lipoprotein